MGGRRGAGARGARAQEARRARAGALKATEEATKRQLKTIDEKAREFTEYAASTARDGLAALDATRAAEDDTTAQLGCKRAAARAAACGHAALATQAEAAEKNAKAARARRRAPSRRPSAAAAVLRRRVAA